MHHLKQKGMATILFILLVGVSVMMLTATVAKNMINKKDASVAAHAQTNAQVMGWAGVSAFREYLLKQGMTNISQIHTLAGETITLRAESNQKAILARNIQVVGCTVASAPCTVTADISADHLAGKAATTIQATYDLVVTDGTVSIAGVSSALSFTGNTFISGTTLAAEVPNTKVVINVDGNMALQAGFKTENIASLTINSTGNVDIDCSLTRCGGTKINVNARGYVHIVNPGSFGDINAIKDVMLTTGVNAENITSLDKVRLTTNSTAKTIRAEDDVTLTNASAEDIYSNGKVNLNTTSEARNISAQNDIFLSLSEVSGNVESARNIDLSASQVRGFAKAYGYVDLDTNSKVHGDVYAKGQHTLGIYNASVRVSISWIGGNVYAKGNISLPDGGTGEDIKGDVNISGQIKLLKTAARGSLNENMTDTALQPHLNFTVPSQVSAADIRQHIEDQLNFDTRVDVRVYKQDANYIFSKDNGIAKVYLNHLRNEATGITYIYENDQQYAVDSHDHKTLVNSSGFYIGIYKLGDRYYAGALCETIDRQRTDVKSGICTSSIIGYLPRVSVSSAFDSNLLNIYGAPDSHGFTLPDTWYVRSIHDQSSIENANLAPGIFYFEGKLVISGKLNGHGDSSENAYLNSFLAEGSIDIIDGSPRIYSPYNVLREGQADLICGRQLQTVDGVKFATTPPATTPATASNQFLTPVNLCKSNTEFAYNMHIDPATNLHDRVVIDHKSVPKLDLGYVAAMSNKVIRVGQCGQIFGDVYARSNIETHRACGINPLPNGITGNINTQGEAPVIDGVQHSNTFGAGSRVVVPHSDYSNAKDIDPHSSTSGSNISAVNVKWSKYK